MSCTYFDKHGYGLCVDEIESHMCPEQIIELLCKAPETKQRAYDCLVRDVADGKPVPETPDEFPGSEIPSHEVFCLDVFDDYDNDYGYHGLHVLLAELISEVEDMEMEAVSDGNGRHFLLIPPVYPWDKVSRRHRSLTKEDADAICNRYLGGFAGEPVKPEYCTVSIW